MSSFKKFEDMEVWKKAMQLVKIIYASTNQTEFSKDFYLVNQLRKSAISIPSNIAEGFERDGNKEFINFLYVEKGTCGELRCQLYIAYDLNYINQDLFQKISHMTMEVSFILKKLINYLQDSDYKGIKYK